MLFRNYVYIDEPFLEQLATQVNLSFDPSSFTESAVSTGSMEAGVKGFIKGEDISTSSKSTTINRSYTASKKLVEFETVAMKDNMITSIGDESLIANLRQGELVLSTGEAIFPEMLSNLDALRQIGGLLGQDFTLSQMDFESEDDIAQKLLPTLFQEIERIPITLEDSGVCVVAELAKDTLLVPAEDFFELAETDIAILGVITRVCPKGQGIEVYDLLKALGLGRQIRRAFEADPKQGTKQYREVVEYPAVQVKPIAVWQ